MRTFNYALALTIVGASAIIQANPSTVILTNRANPGVTDQVPNFPGDQFRQPTAPGLDGGCFFQIYLSPDGAWWGLSTILEGPTTAGTNAIFVGSRDNRSTFRNTVRSGTPAPFPVGAFTAVGPPGFQHGVNNAGVNFFRIALAGGTGTAPESIYRATALATTELAKTGDAMPGFAGLAMRTFDSINVLGDGATIAYRVLPTGVGTTDAASVMVRGATPVGVASGIGPGFSATLDAAASFPTPLAGDSPRKLMTSVLHSFRVSPNGMQFVYQGGIHNTGTTTFSALIHNGRVVVRVGGPVNGVTHTAQSVGAAMAANVNNSGYITRFALNDGGTDDVRTDVVYRNSVIMARTGDPVATGSTELWDDNLVTPSIAQTTFGNAVFNNLGETVISGWTNSGNPFNDEIMVLNDNYKQIVIAREGDPVDLDGNGLFDDNAFIEWFYATHMALDDNLNLYYRVRLRDDTALAIGQAFIRQRLPLPGDVDGNGEVDLTDIDQIIANYLTNNVSFDIDLNGEVDLTDIDIAISNYLRAH